MENNRRRWLAVVLAAALLSGCGQSGGANREGPGPDEPSAAGTASGDAAQDGGAQSGNGQNGEAPNSEAPNGEAPGETAQGGETREAEDGQAGQTPVSQGAVSDEELLHAVVLSGIAAADWKSGAEIAPDLLCDFYMIDTLTPLLPDGWDRDEREIPVEKLAESLSKTFEGVTADQLRKAEKHYVKATDSLRIKPGIGGGSTCRVTEQREENGLTVLEFDVLAGGVPENVVRHVALTVDLTKTPRKFLACAVTAGEAAAQEGNS